LKAERTLQHPEKHLKAFSMDRAVDDVVLAPFRDIVSHGQAAINNAENIGDDEMLKSAQVVLKEGERAIKRIEPVCRKVYEDYGANFVDALMDNGKDICPPLSSTQC
jgi:hypothetical protein